MSCLKDLRITAATSACAAAVCLGLPAQALAAIECNAVTASAVSGTTPTLPTTGNLDVIGSLNVTCTRLATDATTATVFIGMNNGLNVTGTTRRTKRTTPNTAHFIIYYISRNALPANQNAPTGLWTTATARAPGNTATGGLAYPVVFSSAATTAQSYSIPFYFRMRNADHNANAAPAGTFTDTVLVQVKPTQASTTIWSSANLAISVVKEATCRFTTAPGNIAMAYTAFSAASVAGRTPFNAACTNLTPYTMAVTPNAAVLAGLRYTVALNRTSDTGRGSFRSYTATATITAGQAGTCAASTCAGTQAHSVVITY